MEEKHKYTQISITNGSIIRIILFGLLIVLLYTLRQTVLIILTSIVIASFVESAVRKMEKHKINRTVSAICIYFIFLTAVGVIVYTFFPLIIDEVSSIVALMTKYLPSAKSLQGIDGAEFLAQTQQVVGNLSHIPLQNLGDGKAAVSSISTGLIQALIFIFGGIVNFLLIFVLSFYLSIQKNGIESFLSIITPPQHIDYIVSLWQRTERKIGLWFQGQMLLGLIIAIVVYATLLILGIPYALLLAILAGVAELIPFGLILAIIPAIGFAYTHGGVSEVLIVAAVYFITQQFENYVIAPLIVRKVVGISPIMVILSLLIGVRLAGFWGLILAIPVAVAIMEFTNDIEKKRKNNLLA
jgi:predicted PurR-regulated permease PerM